MDTGNSTQSKTSMLRQRAEALLKEHHEKENLTSAEADLLKLIHELEVHQIELELNNEELILANQRAKEATEKYIELYDFAPSGYFTLSRQGEILEVNLKGAQMLGKERYSSINSKFSQFISNDTRVAFNIFLSQVFNGKSTASCEVSFIASTDSPVYAILSGILTSEGKQCIVTVFDISERKQAEEVLRKSEDSLRTAREAMLDSFLIFSAERDEQGKIIDFIFLDMNSNAERMLQMSCKQLTGKRMCEELPINRTNGFFEKYKKVVETGIPLEEEFYLPETHVPAAWYYHQVVKCDDGIVISHRDITKRKLVEEALVRATENQQILLDNIPTQIWYLTDEVTYGAINKAHAVFNGVKIEDFAFKNLYDIFPKDIADVCKQSNFEVFTSKKDIYTEEWVPHVSGEQRLISIIKTPKLREDGSVEYVVCSAEDITCNKMAEITLKKSEERFALAIDASEQGIWDWNIETNEVFISKQWKMQMGYDDLEIRNDFGSWVELLHPDDKEASLNAVQTYLNNPIEHLVLEFRLRHKDGSYRWIFNKASSILNRDGKVVRLFGAHSDITDWKEAEILIKKQKDELKRLNAFKDKFFSIIAHDLKSPFNSIVGLSEILVEQINEKDYEGIEKIGGIIHQSSLRAMNLLNNLMEWSRSQTGRMEFNPHQFDLKEFIHDIAPLFEDIALQKGIAIIRELPENVIVFADKDMINTVLRNLISNAIKFTKPGGEIIVSVNEEKDKIMVSVKDNGIGIPKAVIGKLFRIDENYSTRGTANEAGTGLGLMLCKELIERHDGEIWVESEVEKGSTFYFTLP